MKKSLTDDKINDSFLIKNFMNQKKPAGTGIFWILIVCTKNNLNKLILVLLITIVNYWRSAKDTLRMQESAAVAVCLQIDPRLSTTNYSNRRLSVESSGNWCGHNPETPRFFGQPESHKARPKILTWAMDAWRRFYTLPTSYFNELRVNRKSSRRQRSESREAVASIAQVLLHYTELASLRVGVPHVTNGFRSLTIEFLAKKAGIGLKRAQRAICILKRAGYLKLIERFDTKEGSGCDENRFIGLAAVKCLTPSFFKACGINLQALSAQRKLARRRINRRFYQHVQELQEKSSPLIHFTSLVGNQKNSKAHCDHLLKHLKSEEKQHIKARDRERKRLHSLMESWQTD